MDKLHRFMFDGTDIRGELVRVDAACEKILAVHDYPVAVADLLSEFIAASALLGAMIKFEGRLVLQAKSQGQVSLMMAEVTHDGNVRGIARQREPGVDVDRDFSQLLAGGTLAVTVEPDRGERYQSIVPLVGNSLAACLEGYFEQSEQLNTRIMLSAEQGQSAGMLLQQLPTQLVRDQKGRDEQWQHVVALGQSVTGEELRSLEPADLLLRLYASDPVRLVDSRPLRFDCSCSYNRTAQALMALGADELESLFAETPTVQVDCEFCASAYSFTRESLAALLRGDQTEH